MQDVVLTDIVSAPTRGKNGILVMGGDPGRGKSTCSKTLEYSWAEIGVELGIIDPTTVREHERALSSIDDDKKLVIDAHRNTYSLDSVRMALRNNAIIEELARQGRSDIDEDVLPQPTDHLLGLAGFAADSEAGRRFQKHVSPRNLAAKGIGTSLGLISYLRDLPPSEKTTADEHLLIELEGLAGDRHLRALFDEDLTVPDFSKYQIQIWNTAWLELPRSEETAKEHLHRQQTPRQRAGRAIYGLAIDTIMQQFFSRPKNPSMLTVEECYDWIHSAAGGRAAYRLMTQGRKSISGGQFVVQNPVVTFERIGSEFITQKLNFGFKSAKMARHVLEWCGRDLDRHPDLLRQYAQDTSPVMRVNRRNRQRAHLHGTVIPGKEGQAWLLDEVDNFGKLQCFTHPDPAVQAQFDTNPLTAQHAQFDTNPLSGLQAV
jgi:AAA-like domain